MYVILALPVAIPLTTPVEEPTVATDVVPLLHVPPPVALLRVVEPPTHSSAVPVFAPGAALTVTVATLRQPDDIVYVIFAVPVPIAVTTPPLTVATVPSLVVHEPPGVAQLSALVPPGHSNNPPVIVAGKAPPFTSFVEAQPYAIV